MAFEKSEDNASIVGEFWAFMRVRKKWWLSPIVVMLGALGLLIGTLLTSFEENQLWSGVGTTPCNGNSQGDPIVIYDWLSDRFVLTWFAFASGSGPFYQCIAAAKSSDPVSGGWWLYAVHMDPGTPGSPTVGDINDYGKFGLWHDCLYMAANEFTPAGAYDGIAFASFSRADLYSGAPLTYSLGYLSPASNAFTLIPSNNQGRVANAAQPGTPNYFVSESGTAFAFEHSLRPRGQEVHGRHELRGRRHAQRRDECKSDDLHLSARRDRAAAEHREEARHDRRPDYAEGSVSQDRGRRIAMGDSSGGFRFGNDCNAVGADQCHWRHDRHHASAAADLCARRDLVSVHG